MDRATFSVANDSDALDIPHRRWKDHPATGADYPDVTPGTAHGHITRRVIDALAQHLPPEVEVLAGIDIGGLGLAGALAYRNGLGFIDVRKVDSMKADIIRSIMANYELGSGVVISKAGGIAGRKLAIVDDCLMTGGTALAAIQLARRLGATCVTALFVFALEGMGGRERLEQDGVTVHVLQTLPRNGPDRLGSV